MSALTEALLVVIGGSFGAAIVNKLGDLLLQKSKFKNDKDVKAEEEAKKEYKEMCDTVKVLKTANKYILLNQIIHLGHKYIQAGVVDYDDRRRLNEMHDVYHNGLGGNGDATLLMEAVNDLPLKNAPKS